MLGDESRRSPVTVRLNELEDSVVLADGIRVSGSQSSGLKAFGDNGCHLDSEVLRHLCVCVCVVVACV